MAQLRQLLATLARELLLSRLAWEHAHGSMLNALLASLLLHIGALCFLR